MRNKSGFRKAPKAKKEKHTQGEPAHHQKCNTRCPIHPHSPSEPQVSVPPTRLRPQPQFPDWGSFVELLPRKRDMHRRNYLGSWECFRANRLSRGNNQEQGTLEHRTRRSGCGATNLNRPTGPSSWVMAISHGRGYCLLASRQSDFPDVIFQIDRKRYWSFHLRTKLHTRATLLQSKESWSRSGKFNEGWIRITSCPVNLISIITTTPP